MAKARGSLGSPAVAGALPARAGTALRPLPATVPGLCREAQGQPRQPHATTLARLPSPQQSHLQMPTACFPVPPDLPPPLLIFFFFLPPPPPPSFLSSSWVKNNQVSGKQQLLLRLPPCTRAPENSSALGSPLRPLLAALSFLLPTPYRDLTNMLGLCLPAQLERNLTIAWPGRKERRTQISPPPPHTHPLGEGRPFLHHPGALGWVPARPRSFGCWPEGDGGGGMHGVSTPRRAVVPALSPTWVQ